MEKTNKTLKYRCKVCGYIYSPDRGDEKRGIRAGILFEELPDSWRCPVCQYGKSHFYQVKDFQSLSCSELSPP
ncbi:MAG: rubredoxin [Aquificae bacterium]|nr:rubredoxin [Aquificota bacterium]